MPILEDAADGKLVATYDYSLAFDYTDPEIACWLFSKLGMPQGTADLLKGVWTGQRMQAKPAKKSMKFTLPYRREMPGVCWLCRPCC